MNKYNARKTRIDGITFDSQAEGCRYCELIPLQESGQISNLRVHPSYIVWDGIDGMGKRQKIVYEPDFVYVENGATVAEDVKGVETATFRLKAKMFRVRYPDIQLKIIK